MEHNCDPLDHWTLDSNEYIVQDEPEYLATIRTYNAGGMMFNFMHLDFKVWTLTAFKKLLGSWDLFRNTIRGPLFALSNGEKDQTWSKFVTRLNFEYFMDVECPDGVTRPCFISKDPQNG